MNRKVSRDVPVFVRWLGLIVAALLIVSAAGCKMPEIPNLPWPFGG